jgi:regulator of protease activity HflC (stomatin/prohibitin superfamily)
MPGTFIAAIIFAVLAAIALVIAFLLKGLAENDTDAADARVAAFIATGVLGAVFVVLTLLSSWNPVPTQDIGIVTSFGQPTGHLGAGAHFTAPWDQVTDMDEAIQVTDSTFTARIAGGQTAQATFQVRWRVGVGASDDVFKNYKNSTSGVENGLLTPELNAAANPVLDGYDPLTPLATGAAAGTTENPSTTQLAAQIGSALTSRIAPDVQVITLVLKPLVYDSTVQGRINSVLAQTAKTDVAKQSELTAQAQAKANQIIEQSVANNPLVLVQQCMNAIADGQLTPPAGFSCWPGTGSGSGVVIPASSK